MNTKKIHKFSWDMVGNLEIGRPTLGVSARVEVYRLLQASLTHVSYGEYEEECKRFFYKAGLLAGKEFSCKHLAEYESFEEFFNNMVSKVYEYAIAIVKLGMFSTLPDSFSFIVYEDLSYSGIKNFRDYFVSYSDGFFTALTQSVLGEDYNIEANFNDDGSRIYKGTLKSL